MRFTMSEPDGIGAYFGGELARVGHEVTLFARGAHLDACERAALTVRTPRASSWLASARRTTPNELPASDVAIVAVKSYSLPDVTPSRVSLPSGCRRGSVAERRHRG
jgi:2-dehydropantoate 2-reductase